MPGGTSGIFAPGEFAVEPPIFGAGTGGATFPVLDAPAPGARTKGVGIPLAPGAVVPAGGELVVAVSTGADVLLEQPAKDVTAKIGMTKSDFFMG